MMDTWANKRRVPYGIRMALHNTVHNDHLLEQSGRKS